MAATILKFRGTARFLLIAAALAGFLARAEADDTSIVLAADEIDVAAEVDEGFVRLAQLESGQPSSPASQPSSQAQPRRTLLGQTRPVFRLASMPGMFGDVYFSGGQLLLIEQGRDQTGQQTVLLADIPTAGGGRRVKIGENNSSLPRDRIHFMYNHFHNALQTASSPVTPGGPPVLGQTSVDRYTVGVEKTFFDEWTSIELRMPLTGAFHFQGPDMLAAPGPVVEGGSVGNLAVIFKSLLCRSDTTAVGFGLGFDTPTGSDVRVETVSSAFTFHNDAYHLLPFIGMASAPNERLFYNAFAQLDFALNGNRVEFLDRQTTMADSLGRWTDQNLLYLDFSAGWWLHRNECRCGTRGLAAIAELHYTTTLQDADRLGFSSPFRTAEIGNRFNRVDLLNITGGLHAQFTPRTSVRVAAVAPLRTNFDPASGRDTDRAFDAELQVFVNHRF